MPTSKEIEMITPTHEQKAVLDFIANRKENLLVTARAGAAKTTTIEMAINQQQAPSLYLAFNRSVANEAKERVPHSCQVYTMNGIGHRTWATYLRKRLNLYKSKNYSILKDRTEDQHRKRFADMLRTIAQAKQHGYIPDVNEFTPIPRSLVTRDDFYSSIEYIFNEGEKMVIDECIQESLRQALQGTIDFDDQVLCCAVFPVSYRNIPNTIYVDEAQDLSRVNHIMIKKMRGISRLIAVGDDAQAIYGFRGASRSSMLELKTMFKMEELKLTTTFRCAVQIVEHANWLTGDLVAWRKELGYVSWLTTEWDIDDLTLNSLILCRNNAPIIGLASIMIERGIIPQFLGRDFLAELAKIARSLKSWSEEGIDEWEENRRRTSRNTNGVTDRANCLRFLLKQANTTQGAASYLESLADMRGNSFILSTVHKAKGLEHDTVYILGKHLFDNEGQDLNLLYVAQTRAKNQLTYLP